MSATKMRIGWFGLMTLAVGALALAGAAQATTFTWAGGASGTWDTTGANWSGVPADPWDSANGPGNIADFNTAAATPSVSGTVYAGGIVFGNTATVGGSGTINLAGSAPNLAVNTGVTGTIDSAVNLIPSSVWITSSSGNLIVNGKISGSVPNGLFVNQDGTTTLNNPANDFTSSFVLYRGILSISSIADSGVASALGKSGPISFGHDGWNMTGTLQFTGASGGSSDRQMIIWGSVHPENGPTTNGGIIENTVSGQTLALSGGINTVSGITPTLQLIGAGDGVESGVISGSNLAIIKSGAGTWTLTGANTYTGPTTVNGGTLIIHPAGSVQGASTISVNAGGVLALGQAANSNTLNFNGGTLSVACDNTGTGGTITYAGGNVIHTFTAAGESALAIPEAVSASVLVVAGGGGGGSQYGGGGGAGGLIYYGGETPANGRPEGTSFAIPAGVSPVTVGAGGPGGSGSTPQNGGQGGDSVFATLTATGGGYGGGNDNGGGAGGSGGGASFGGHAGGFGTSGQGNGGGPSDYGGGGGAGVSASGNWGGDGLPYSISGTPTWYAGGGGGINSPGGQGGGGYGSRSGGSGQAALAGVANTGGGGGGAWGDAGSDGGSGIVIVSYPYNANVVNPYQANVTNATTLSGTITVPATSTLDAGGTGGQITVASGMSGAGGINIASSGVAGGVVVYSAAQAYTGATTISNGATLRVTLPSALPTVTDVHIASGAKLDLTFEGTNTVRTLSIDGVLQERNRVYGSVSRPQALGGTGFLKVTDGAAPKGTMILVQ